jgi:hypothetical protein
MEKEQTTEGNKLIAEFMGNKVIFDGISYHFYYLDGKDIERVANINIYSKSWDWLMQVIYKMNKQPWWEEYEITHLMTALVSADINYTWTLIMEALEEYKDYSLIYNE